MGGHEHAITSARTNAGAAIRVRSIWRVEEYRGGDIEVWR